MWTPRDKQLPWPALLAARDAARARGQVVVWTNGTFDLLHPGHLSSLLAARALGDVLVVGLNSDASVRGYKGPGRPILTQGERAAMLAGLECVDYVVVFDEPTPEEALRRLRPDVHCKGAEYAPPHGRPVPEAATVLAGGGRVEYLPIVPGISTTELLRRVGAKGGAPGLLFLDRDGTLIADLGYPRDPDGVRQLPGAAEAVRELVALGYTPAVVSNQSGVGRGVITPAQALAVHERFTRLFAEASGVPLKAWYCPHVPEEGCPCRKPRPGLLLQAATHFGRPVGPDCALVGDKASDVEAGRAAGCGLSLLFAGDWPATVAALKEWRG